MSLNDAAHDFYRLTSAALLGRGALYDWDVEFTVASTASYVFSFETADRPVLMTAVTIDFSGTVEIDVDIFSGGAVSGGSEITDIFARNQVNKGPLPYAPNSLFEGRTIDTPGTKIFSVILKQAQRQALLAAQGGGIIFEANTLHYINVFNDGGQEGDVHIHFSAGNL